MQKEQFSGAYLRAVCAVAGFSLAEPEVDDDSVDFLVAAAGGGRTTRRPRVELQLKSTARNLMRADGVHYPLKSKNYEDLRTPDVLVPRILVVVVLPEAVDQWISQSEEELALRHCGYWLALRGMPAEPGQTTFTVLLPRTQILTPDALQSMMLRIDAGGLP